jgi:hypothetical protein
VGTAVAFALVLPQIKLLPSPREQRRLLEAAVAERTKEKDLLIREINHRIGNQLQVISSLVSIETRRASCEETLSVLERFRTELIKMSESHHRHSAVDYLGVHGPSTILPPRAEPPKADGGN